MYTLHFPQKFYFPNTKIWFLLSQYIVCTCECIVHTVRQAHMWFVSVQASKLQIALCLKYWIPQVASTSIIDIRICFNDVVECCGLYDVYMCVCLRPLQSFLGAILDTLLYQLSDALSRLVNVKTCEVAKDSESVCVYVCVWVCMYMNVHQVWYICVCVHI